MSIMNELRQRMVTDEDLLRKYRSHLTGGAGSSYDLKTLLCQTYDMHSDIYHCMNSTAKANQLNYYA